MELLRSPFLLIDEAKDDHARHKEKDKRKDPLAEASGNGDDQSINQWAENGCKLSSYRIESEKFSAICLRGEKAL